MPHADLVHGELTHHSPDADPAELNDVIRRDGALVIDGLATPDEMDAVLTEMRPFIDATPTGSDEFTGRATRRSGALIARSPASRPLVQHPLILDLAGRVLDRATSFQIHLTQTIAIGPGEPAQTLHRDEWAFDFFDFPPDYHVQLNTIWALTDFNEENGATRLVPGSQDWPKQRLSHDDTPTAAAEMSKGSCLVYTGKVFHGGGANRSDAERVGLNITYNVGWLRQEENQYLSVPHDVAATLDDDLLRLMGYRIGAYALGYIDDVRDPLDAIRARPDGRSGAMSFAPQT